MPIILQALLTGLAIMCPDDPHLFIIEKLQFIKENGLECLEWYAGMEANFFLDNSKIL